MTASSYTSDFTMIALSNRKASTCHMNRYPLSSGGNLAVKGGFGSSRRRGHRRVSTKMRRWAIGFKRQLPPESAIRLGEAAEQRCAAIADVRWSDMIFKIRPKVRLSLLTGINIEILGLFTSFDLWSRFQAVFLRRMVANSSTTCNFIELRIVPKTGWPNTHIAGQSRWTHTARLAELTRFGRPRLQNCKTTRGWGLGGGIDRFRSAITAWLSSAATIDNPPSADIRPGKGVQIRRYARQITTDHVSRNVCISAKRSSIPKGLRMTRTLPRIASSAALLA